MKTDHYKQFTTSLLILAGSLLATLPSYVNAQTAEEEAQRSFVSFDSSKTYAQKGMIVSQMKVIANKWPGNWLTNYYVAYEIAVLSFDEKDGKKRDLMLGEGDLYFNKIRLMSPSNEEVSILGALLASARIAAKPSAYKKYGDIRDEYLKTAKSNNPDNPRVYYLQGNSKYYTPKMFGGGPKNALPYYEKASKLFDQTTEHDIRKPYWGKNQNSYMIGKCKQELQ
jgi:hypothetical protein